MSDSDVAWMRHPDLPDYPPNRVVRSQVPFLTPSGWIECDAPPEPEPEPDDSDDGDTPPASAEEPSDSPPEKRTTRRATASKDKDS